LAVEIFTYETKSNSDNFRENCSAQDLAGFKKVFSAIGKTAGVMGHPQGRDFLPIQGIRNSV
jgi:hypothetical protein